MLNLTQRIFPKPNSVTKLYNLIFYGEMMKYS